MFSFRKRMFALTATLAIVLWFVPPGIADAQILIDPCPPGGGPCYGGDQGFYTPDIDELPSDVSLTDLIVRVIEFVLNFVLLIGVIMVIIAGFYLILSMGDESAKDKAKKIILYLIAGIILIIFARLLVMAVANVAQGTN